MKNEASVSDVILRLEINMSELGADVLSPKIAVDKLKSISTSSTMLLYHIRSSKSPPRSTKNSEQEAIS